MDASVDSLPYYDKELEIPGLKDLVKSEVDKEMKRMPKVGLDDPRVPADMEPFTSPHLAELLSAYPSQTLQTTKAIDPSKWNPFRPEEGDSTEEWQEAERKARIGLSMLDGRNENLSLLSTYGPNAWLIRNYQLESQAKEVEAEVEVWKEKVVEVNRKRRVFQESTGKHLSSLENRWQDLITGTIQLEMASRAMELEVEVLKGQEARLERDLEGRV